MRLGATLTRVRDRVVRGRRAARPAAQLRAAVPDASDPRRAVARAAAAVGVDIGSAWIKIVELVGGRDGFSVRARLTVPTPPGTVRGGRISFPPVVGRVLRDALGHAGIRTRRAVASVSGHVSLVREVRLPRLSGDELREAARFEVMRYLPYPITEATYDAFVLGEVPDTGAARMEVLLAAARTDLLAQHVDTLRAAGLEPAVIDVEPFALLRAMVPAGTPAGRPGLYLHLGATHTGILIVDGTTPRVARSVVGGGNVITQRIAAQRGLSLEEAETYKIRLSGPDVPEGEARTIEGLLRDAVADLTLEVRRSIDYFQGQYRGVMPDRAVLTGGGAMLPGLPRLLGIELDMPAQVGDPFRQLARSAQPGDAGPAPDHGAPLAVALGLALRGVEEA